MSIEDQIAGLLRAGMSARAVAQELHAGYWRVRAVREHLGIPAHPPGPVAETMAETFRRRTAEDSAGHVVWLGRDLRMPTSDGGYISPAVWAFQRKNGRVPVGRVLSWCSVRRCMTHIEDQVMRDRLRSQLAGLGGEGRE